MLSDKKKMKSEINNSNKCGEFSNMNEINSTLLKIQWVKEEITRRISKNFEINEKDTAPRDTLKLVLRGKFIVANTYIKVRRISNCYGLNCLPHPQ